MTPSRPIGMETIILVDSKDKEIGTGEKLEVHQKGLLHRAFSVNIINRKGEFLLQQRAKIKYHSGGLWTNACCSHPHAGETLETAIHRRLKEEMGFDTDLKELFTMIFRAAFSNGLTEHEFLHVYIGQWNGKVIPNPEEADDYRWIGIDELKKEIEADPDSFTPWFRLFFPRLSDMLG